MSAVKLFHCADHLFCAPTFASVFAVFIELIHNRCGPVQSALDRQVLWSVCVHVHAAHSLQRVEVQRKATASVWMDAVFFLLRRIDRGLFGG